MEVFVFNRNACKLHESNLVLLIFQLKHFDSRYANVTFGQPCGIENTTTIGIGSSGEQTTVVMTRDNCQSPNLFCDPDIMICEHTKYIGGTCMADGECQTVSVIIYLFNWVILQRNVFSTTATKMVYASVFQRYH